MNTATTTILLNEGFFARRNWFDWLFAAIVTVGGLYALQRYGSYMDVYEKGILLGAIPCTVWLGWFWRPLQVLMLVVVVLALAAIGLYQQDGAGNLARAETVFGLKYFLSSQSAILWMSMLFFMSTAFYWLGMFARGEGHTMSLIGSRLAWVAVGMALIGTLVRWYENNGTGSFIATHDVYAGTSNHAVPAALDGTPASSSQAASTCSAAAASISHSTQNGRQA